MIIVRLLIDSLKYLLHCSINISDDHSDGRSEKESELDAAKYIPGERQSMIGVRPAEVAVKIEDITDIRQLENLMRVHIMLAQVAGHSSPHSRDYVLMAYAFLYRIWQVTGMSFFLVNKVFCCC